MCKKTVSYFKRIYKVQRNERQSRSERADQRRLEQTYQSMRGEIIVEYIRYGSTRLE